MMNARRKSTVRVARLKRLVEIWKGKPRLT